jgi:spore germination protein KA
VVTLPYLFIEGLQSSEDYLHTSYYSTFIRALRFIAFLAAVFSPAILCGVIGHDSTVMPSQFYGIIDEARQNIPITFFWEILTVLLLFEILREVAVRMPRTVGDAVGIVGSVILGNTAVEAGIVSSVGVIIVAFSAVCAFITPAYMYVIVLWRIVSLVLTEIFGFYGLALSVIWLVGLLVCRKSFGVSYLTPIFPFNKKGMEDTIYVNTEKIIGRRERLGRHKKQR